LEQQKLKARISRVRKNAPIFLGRYQQLPPLKKDGSNAPLTSIKADSHIHIEGEN